MTQACVLGKTYRGGKLLHCCKAALRLAFTNAIQNAFTNAIKDWLRGSAKSRLESRLQTRLESPVSAFKDCSKMFIQ